MDFVLAGAAIIMALRLPSFMRRLGMSKADKIAFVFLAFSVLLLGWLAVRAFGLITVFI